MKYTSPRLAALLIAALLAVSLSSCKTEVVDVADEPAPEEVIAVEDGAVDEQPADVPVVPEGEPSDETPQAPAFTNPLTGEACDEETSHIRPVGMMINNIHVALPQQGIIHADVMYEVLAEGGITRLFCLFTNYKDLPETGSIRSSRDYYIDLADAHDAIYVHCGGSPGAYETLAARKTDNIDGIYFSTPFYRNEWRRTHMGTEHSMMTTGELLTKGIELKGYRTTSDAKQPFSFAAEDREAEGESAKNVKVVFSSFYATSTFTYDPEETVYYKGQFDEKHIDGNTDEQLAFKNILLFPVAQGQIAGDDKGRMFVSFIGDGEGLYISNGAARKVRWHKPSRTSSYTIFEEDGTTELLLNPGKTYVGLPPAGAEIDFN